MISRVFVPGLCAACRHINKPIQIFNKGRKYGKWVITMDQLTFNIRLSFILHVLFRVCSLYKRGLLCVYLIQTQSHYKVCLLLVLWADQDLSRRTAGLEKLETRFAGVMYGVCSHYYSKPPLARCHPASDYLLFPFFT